MHRICTDDVVASVFLAYIMRNLVITTALLAVLMCCGCLHNLGRPSQVERDKAFALGGQEAISLEPTLAGTTYYVFRFTKQLPKEFLLMDWAAREFADSVRGREFAMGMATSVYSSGYLITAAHCTRNYIYIGGEFSGRRRLVPAVLVCKKWERTGAEYAILKVDEFLPKVLKFGPTPSIEAGIYCLLQSNEVSWDRKLAAGKVLSIEKANDGSHLDTITTDIPTWHGDSGSGVVDKLGRFVGIVTAGEWQLRGFHPKTEKFICLIDEDEVLALVSNYEASNKSR